MTDAQIVKFWQRVDEARGTLTLDVLAKNMGLKTGSLLDLRSDCRLPKVEALLGLSRFLNLSMEFLLTGERRYGAFEEYIPYLAKASDGDLASIRKILEMPSQKSGSSGIKVS
jgi:hypothetical protein